MKNITKKEWGIVSTSIGSILIIVALLTMVGVGSNDTYATAVAECTCTSGTYDLSTGKCVRTTTTETDYKCAYGPDASINPLGYDVCPSTSGCRIVDRYTTTDIFDIYQCTKTETKTETSACTCPEGTENDGSGNCVASTCSPGKYKLNGECKDCLANYFCPGGSNSGAFKCPEHASSCTKSSFECAGGFEKLGNECVAVTVVTCKSGKYYIGQDNCEICPIGYWCPGGTFKVDASTRDGINQCDTGYTTNGTGKTSKTDCVPECENKSIGTICTTSDGKTGTCQDSGSGSGGIVCKANSPGSDTNYVHCDKGWFYTGDGKTCTKCPSGSWCPGGNFLASSLVRDGGVKCPDDRPYSEPGSYQESDCKASGGDPNPPSGGDPSSGGNSNTPSGGDSGTGGNGNGNTNQNPNTATKTPLVIAIIGTISMALGTFAYFKGKKEINTEA